MRPETIEKLEALNRAFYDDTAEAFSETRNAPWAGWPRIVDIAGGFHDVLDAGCGNGRFRASLPNTTSYVGVDSCRALLDDAARHGPSELIHADLWTAPWGERQFDLVVAFGVLHHVPSRARRTTLISTLANAVRPGGHLVITAWRFDPNRALPWSSVDVDADDLEPGDHLLSFGHGKTMRYCHLASDEEIKSWIQRGTFELVMDFESDGKDGKSNRYIVQQRVVPNS